MLHTTGKIKDGGHCVGFSSSEYHSCPIDVKILPIPATATIDSAVITHFVLFFMVRFYAFCLGNILIADDFVQVTCRTF